MRSRPACSYSVRSKRSPRRPTDGAVTARAASSARGDAHVRRVELADHQVEQPPHFGWRLRAGDAGRVLRAHRVPVHAVELVVVEAVAHVGPRLAEDLHLLLREVDVELGGDRDRPGLTRFDRHHRDAALFEVENLAAVGRELRVGLGAGRRRQLARDRRFARQLVERVEVEVLLALGGRRQEQRPAVGADRLRGHIDADRQQAQAPPDVVEDDLDGCRRIARRLRVTLGCRPASARSRRRRRP